jgi:HD-like signal output (HDOD) protein
VSLVKVEKHFLASFLDDLNRNRVVLPTLPEVAVQVRKLVNDPTATDRQISRLIGTDPALTARLLKVVNSSLHRTQEKIENLQTAVTRLGREQVRNLVTALVMQQLYQAKGTQLTRQRLKTLWAHSAKVATLSYVLARRFTQLQPDQALLGGLIHDIGILPILRRAEAYPKLANDPEALEEVIKHLHTIIGPFILDEWNFSPELVAVTSQHEDLWRSEGPAVSYVDVVIVANLHSYLGTQHHLNQKDWSEIPAFAKLGLTPDESIKTIESAREELQELRSLFQ